ncbi:MAG: hypothetical protein ACKVRP_07335 [Bacteroidota bacterium]
MANKAQIAMEKKAIHNLSKPTTQSDLPLFCDYTCRHAEFAPADASGACRREQAVYCALFKKFNNKNNRCLGREAV